MDYFPHVRLGNTESLSDVSLIDSFRSQSSDLPDVFIRSLSVSTFVLRHISLVVRPGTPSEIVHSVVRGISVVVAHDRSLEPGVGQERLSNELVKTSYLANSVGVLDVQSDVTVWVCCTSQGQRLTSKRLRARSALEVTPGFPFVRELDSGVLRERLPLTVWDNYCALPHSGPYGRRTRGSGCMGLRPLPVDHRPRSGTRG